MPVGLRRIHPRELQRDRRDVEFGIGQVAGGIERRARILLGVGSHGASLAAPRRHGKRGDSGVPYRSSTGSSASSRSSPSVVAASLPSRQSR
jgi:hypothetical protein